MGKQNKKVNPERQRARFTKEFKLETVRLLDLGQKPATQLALELGVARNQLYKWQAQLQKTGAASAFRGPGRKPLDEQNELERLKRELKHVTEERDILKKADRKSTRLNSSHVRISYAVFCLKKKYETTRVRLIRLLSYYASTTYLSVD